MAGNSRLFDPSGFGQTQVRGHYWRVLQPWAFSVVGILLVAIVLALFYPAWRKGQNMKTKAEFLQNEIQTKKEELAELQDESGRLKDDPFTVERLSRDTLSVARPGEVIFKFQPYPTNRPVPGEAKRPIRNTEAMRKP